MNLSVFLQVLYLLIMEEGGKRYRDYPSYFKTLFQGRVQKLSIDAGFSCPNRDGTKGVGGCTFCNNRSFNPDYCQSVKTITQQIDEGKRFFSHKYVGQKYLAYFQAYSNTYASLDILKKNMRRHWLVRMLSA